MWTISYSTGVFNRACTIIIYRSPLEEFDEILPPKDNISRGNILSNSPSGGSINYYIIPIIYNNLEYCGERINTIYALQLQELEHKQ